MSREVVDAAVRLEALDPERSFIVQAPAGSGKTELLTRRILTLLARVDEPEEILAITFTRKAAAEMRQRVVQTLQAAYDQTEVNDDYGREGRKLAQAVLERDSTRQWSLLENPSRLGMQTIDSLCSDLTRQLPVTSNFGAELGVLEDSMRLYLTAAERTISNNLKPDELGHEVLTSLLRHLDNNVDRLQQLLADMLSNRDQWLRHNGQVSSRKQMEADLMDLVGERFRVLGAVVPIGLCERLQPLLRHAAHCCEALGQSNTAVLFAGIESLTLPTLDNANTWQRLGHFLLTQAGTARKTGTRKDGFPTSAKDATELGINESDLRDLKEQFINLLDEVKESEDFVALLNETRILPTQGYTDDQWEIMENLLSLLKLSVAELHFVFAEARLVDFSEISLRASRALGEEESPTDLALALDYRIQHILVDEFQDTSISQYQMFAKLVSGWESGDGRTFFAVGDPMQSIYRFRDAEVSLFVQASQRGVGSVVLEPLRLNVNFRSDPAIIDWCNSTFNEIFPSRTDLATGAIPYSLSAAIKEPVEQAGQHFHAFVGNDRAEQATWVGELVETALDTRSPGEEHTVAILVRSKTSLTEIFRELQLRQIRYQAVDIETLGDRLVVKDIVSLCRALQHPQDKLHWLAVLRSPLCGLELVDLHALAGDTPYVTLWTQLNDPAVVKGLSTTGQSRVQKFTSILTSAIERSQRESLVPWLEACWLKAGGPASCVSGADLLAADACFKELARIEEDGLLRDAAYIDRRLGKLFAPASSGQDVRVQIMTIHKSKGLEFDTVILPGLGRKPRTDQSQLLNWFEYYDDDSAGSRLLLAPITETNKEGSSEPILRMITSLQKKKSDNELLRLLYVASTRAKRQLHLLGHTLVKASDELSLPPKNSLLYPLWSSVEEQFIRQHEETHASSSVGDLGSGTDEATELPKVELPKLKRISLDWSTPDFSTQWVAIDNGAIDTPADLEPIEFQWASSSARHVGSVVHRQLQRLADEGLESWSIERVTASHSFYAQQLKTAGVTEDQLESAVENVIQGLTNALNDERGRWLLHKHQIEAQTELRLTGLYNDQLINGVIDRTFVDENNVRWIVDFKTGAHTGGQLDQFIDREQERYQPQLERYAAIMRNMDDREIRLGLYFPLLMSWREWAPGQ